MEAEFPCAPFQILGTVGIIWVMVTSLCFILFPLILCLSQSFSAFHTHIQVPASQSHPNSPDRPFFSRLYLFYLLTKKDSSLFLHNSYRCQGLERRPVGLITGTVTSTFIYLSMAVINNPNKSTLKERGFSLIKVPDHSPSGQGHQAARP